LACGMKQPRSGQSQSAQQLTGFFFFRRADAGQLQMIWRGGNPEIGDS